MEAFFFFKRGSLTRWNIKGTEKCKTASGSLEIILNITGVQMKYTIQTRKGINSFEMMPIKKGKYKSQESFILQSGKMGK